MDLNASRNALTQFLENGKSQVLGLSGLWGAGKTHLWLSLHDTLPAAKTALYASCFGLKSLDEIGRALLQDAASNASKYGEAGGKVIKETGRKLTDALRNIPIIGEAADALLATGALAESVITGMLVRERIIVLDDLERRDAALSLETLFGYVDALKGKGCTVLLIYNEEELSANQGKEWRAVREKCLDTEINLRPTPADACELGLAPDCADRAAIQTTALQLGLTNIRIIKRLERLTGTFRQLMSAQAAPLAPPDFVVNSLVFLGALHCDTQLPAEAVQRFLDDWATYSANQLSSKTAGDFVLPATHSGVSSDAELLRLLADFVLQQQLDASGVHARIQHLDARSRYANGQQAAVDYVDKASYDPDASEQMLLDIATKWAKTGWHTLSPQLASTIIHDLERRNAPALAAEISDAWREHWQNASSEYVADNVLEGLATPIATAIREVNDFRRPAMTVLQAIEGINADPQSASREYMPFLQNIDAEALQKTIQACGREKLKTLLLFYTERLPMLEADHDRYRLAWGKFEHAVSNIVLKNNKPRLSEILLRHVTRLNPNFIP